MADSKEYLLELMEEFGSVYEIGKLKVILKKNECYVQKEIMAGN